MQVVGRRGLKRKALWVVAAKGEECQSSNSMGQVVLWFKNDLRLHDNYVVDRAQQLVKSGKAKQVNLCSISVTPQTQQTHLKLFEHSGLVWHTQLLTE